MRSNACKYSQHLPGQLNIIAECLQRDRHLSRIQLIAMLASLRPSLSPNQMKLVDLPQKHISWIALLAQRWPGERESPKALIKSTLAAGISGWASSSRSKNTVTPIWKTSMKLDDYASAVLSCMRYDELILREVESSSKSNEPLCERPLIMW